MPNKVKYLDIIINNNGKPYYYLRYKGKRESLSDDYETAVKELEERITILKGKDGEKAIPKNIDVDVYEKKMKALLVSAKQRSKERNMSFDIDLEWLMKRLRKHAYRCEFSNMQYSNRGYRDPFQPSLDRIDMLKGYTKENVRITCLIVNAARSDFGDEAVYRLAASIVSLE